jgi:hypothetical protein
MPWLVLVFVMPRLDLIDPAELHESKKSAAF